MTVVVGTAGHIDHGKTSLLRALTGIDADRLPEERRRGMTIDVGYAHLVLTDGDVIDFVDVPGHDRLVGNMLVGAGEIDAALLVIAADDGPRAQTLEHLELLDALGIADGIAVVTKIDLLDPEDPRRADLRLAVERLLARTTLAGSPIVLASATTGEGIEDVRAALVGLRDRVVAAGRSGGSSRDGGGSRNGGGSRDGGGAETAGAPGLPRPAGDPPRLAVDRAFTVRGRGTVVTGSLRGGPVRVGATLRVAPSGASVRVREVQVRGATVEAADGGRVALNIAGPGAEAVQRGDVLTGSGPDGPLVASARILVEIRLAVDLRGGTVAARDGRAKARLDRGAGDGRARLRGGAGDGRATLRGGDGRAGLRDGATLRLHLGTAQVDATVRKSRMDLVDPDGTRVTTLRLATPIAVAAGDRFALRRSSPAATVGGGRVLDPLPPSGASRRRATPAHVAALRDATTGVGDPGAQAAAHAAALVALHGGLPRARVEALAAGTPPDIRIAGPMALAPGVASALEDEILAAVSAFHADHPDAPGLPLAQLRPAAARSLRRSITVTAAGASAAVASVVDDLVTSGRLARDGDTLRDPVRAAGPPPALAAAMGRLEAALSTAAPPPFAEAVRASGCPPEGVSALERSGRIVRLEPDLAFASSTYAGLTATALAMAAAGPLTPAAFRDATASSRRFALAILEDLDRRGLLARTPDGHVPGPRAARPGTGSGGGST